MNLTIELGFEWETTVKDNSEVISHCNQRGHVIKIPNCSKSIIYNNYLSILILLNCKYLYIYNTITLSVNDLIDIIMIQDY